LNVISPHRVHCSIFINMPSISYPERVICRPTLSIPVVVFTWTSTFSNPAGLNFVRN
jgi:hypothetical protein